MELEALDLLESVKVPDDDIGLDIYQNQKSAFKRVFFSFLVEREFIFNNAFQILRRK